MLISDGIEWGIGLLVVGFLCFCLVVTGDYLNFVVSMGYGTHKLKKG